MRRSIVLLILLFVFSGCSKEIQNNRALNGNWKIVDFSLYDYTGLKTKPECTGIMNFESDGKKTKTGTYSISLSYGDNQTPSDFIEQGIYHIENKNIIQLLSSEGEKKMVTLVYHTKEDLVLDFPNVEYLRYYIVLRK